MLQLELAKGSVLCQQLRARLRQARLVHFTPVLYIVSRSATARPGHTFELRIAIRGVNCGRILSQYRRQAFGRQLSADPCNESLSKYPWAAAIVAGNPDDRLSEMPEKRYGPLPWPY